MTEISPAQIEALAEYENLPMEDWVFQKFSKDLDYLTDQQRERFFEKFTGELQGMISTKG
jgi:hypothetical protein